MIVNIFMSLLILFFVILLQIKQFPIISRSGVESSRKVVVLLSQFPTERLLASVHRPRLRLFGLVSLCQIQV